MPGHGLTATWNESDNICEFESDTELATIEAALANDEAVVCVISCDPEDEHIGTLNGVKLIQWSTTNWYGHKIKE